MELFSSSIDLLTSPSLKIGVPASGMHFPSNTFHIFGGVVMGMWCKLTVKSLGTGVVATDLFVFESD